MAHATASAAKASRLVSTTPSGLGVPAPGPRPSMQMVPSMIDRCGRRTEDMSVMAISSGFSSVLASWGSM